MRINQRIDGIALDENESDKPQKRKKEKKPAQPPESAEQAAKIIDKLYSFNPSLANTCHMSSLTGLRYSDASWLVLQDFKDSDNNWKSEMSIIQQKVFRIKLAHAENKKVKELEAGKVTKEINIARLKRESTVVCYINDEMKEIVEDAIRLKPKGCNLLFQNPRSKMNYNGKIHHRPMTVAKANATHVKVKNALNLDFELGTHSWRKFFANNAMKESGMNLVLVRDLLGHSNIASTSKYLSSIDVNKHEFIKNIKLDEINQRKIHCDF